MGLPEIVVYGNCRLCVGGRNQDRVWEEDRGRTLFVYLDPRQFETFPSDPDNSKVFLAKPFVVVPAHGCSSSWSAFTAQDRVWEDDKEGLFLLLSYLGTVESKQFLAKGRPLRWPRRAFFVVLAE